MGITSNTVELRSIIKKTKKTASNEDILFMIGLLLILLACISFGLSLVYNYKIPQMTVLAVLLFLIGLACFPKKENDNNKEKKKK